MNNLTIRKAKEYDIPQIAALLKETFFYAPWNESWTKEDSERRIAEIFSYPKHRGYLCFEGEKLLGVCLGKDMTYLSFEEYMIDEFFVSHDCQGKGVGSSLFQAMVNSLRGTKMKKILLMTNTGFPALKFYEKNGMWQSQAFQMMEMDL